VSIALRPFRPGDDQLVVDLWNGSLVRDPISVSVFRRQTLLNPNFDAAGCLIADASDGAAAGFVLAFAPRSQRLHSGAIGAGRIVGLGVLSEYRRHGLGTQLLEAALDYLKERGCVRVSVAAHEYYAAGVDSVAYAEGIGFLTKRGFQQVGQATAMGRLLYDLEWPEEIRAAERRLATDGIAVIHFEPQQTQALAAYFAAEFPDWIEFFARKLDARHDLDDMVIAVTKDGEVVGYCQHLDTDHIGPFGVAAAYRNRGIGSVMLYRLLDRMREKGFRFAWFGETGRARPYYERAGFFVTRTYTLLKRDL